MEIDGIAHIFPTAANFGRAREFYLPFLGLKAMTNSDQVYQSVGGRTAVAIARLRRRMQELPSTRIHRAASYVFPRPRVRRCR